MVQCLGIGFEEQLLSSRPLHFINAPETEGRGSSQHFKPGNEVRKIDRCDGDTGNAYHRISADGIRNETRLMGARGISREQRIYE